MNLTIFTPQLRFVTLPKSSLWSCMPAIISSLLMNHERPNGTFIHYTETLDEISILIDQVTFKRLIAALPANIGVVVNPHPFRAMSVSEGEISSMVSFDVTTGLVSAFSSVLAAANISIFYVSTYQTDYIVIKSTQIEAATQVLKHQFGDEVEIEDEADSGGGGGGVECSDEVLLHSTHLNSYTYLAVDTVHDILEAKGELEGASSSTATLSSSSASSAPSTVGPLKLHALPQTFYLAHFTAQEITSYLAGLIRIFFFPPAQQREGVPNANAQVLYGDTPDRFFSYSHIDSSISMMLDQPSLAIFQSSSLHTSQQHQHSITFEKWRGLQVAEVFGFDECGIVASLSNPLTQNKICPYYLSTFVTDYVLVQEGKWSQAEAILASSAKFQFVPRQQRVFTQLQHPDCAPPSASFKKTNSITHQQQRPSVSTPQWNDMALSGPISTVYALSSVELSADGSRLIHPPSGSLSHANSGSRAIDPSHRPVTTPTAISRGVSSSDHPGGVIPYSDLDPSQVVGGTGGPTILLAHPGVAASVAPYMQMSNQDMTRQHSGEIKSSTTATGGPTSYLLLSTASLTVAPPSPASSAPIGRSSPMPTHLPSQPVIIASPYAAVPNNSLPYAAVHDSQPHGISTVPVDKFEAMFTPAAVSDSTHGHGYHDSDGGSSGSTSDSDDITPFTAAPDTFGHLELERLKCFVDVERIEAMKLLATYNPAHTPLEQAQKANPSYSSHEPPPQPMSTGSKTSSVVTRDGDGEGRFLIRRSQDPSELLEGEVINPNLFVLCYNKSNQMKKSKIFRLPGLGLSLGTSGHRIFPTAHAIIQAIVGSHAKPVA